MAFLFIASIFSAYVNVCVNVYVSVLGDQFFIFAFIMPLLAIIKVELFLFAARCRYKTRLILSLVLALAFKPCLGLFKFSYNVLVSG
jgi:hypothetical protein